MEHRNPAATPHETAELVASRMLDDSVSISARWWALFSLRNMPGAVAREALSKAMRDPSELLAHEAAFALGQMRDAEAIPTLRNVLEDVASVPSIVRHEAAEALGAIGASEAIILLKRSLVSDPAPEVRETCELALRKIEQGIESTPHDGEDSADSPFFAVDPAGPAGSKFSTSDLRKTLMNVDVGMYERYAALFALRNRGGAEAVDAIIAALDANSALLRHEVAYVLGQLQDKSSTDALVKTLMDTSELPMVRHEAAEALGAIADIQSIALVTKFQSDPEPLVAQSCEVALSVLDQELQDKSFEGSVTS